MLQWSNQLRVTTLFVQLLLLHHRQQQQVYQNQQQNIKSLIEYYQTKTCCYDLLQRLNVAGGEGDADELFNQAVEIIKNEGKASTSFLQRKLQIGYNRAARIIDMMEEKGIVSKANHVGKREVL